MWGGEMREQRDRPGRWWPLVLGVVVTVVVALLNLDVRIQDGLARPQSLDWVLSGNGFERWVYHQGPLIPMSVFVVGLVVWLGSFGVIFFRTHKAPCRLQPAAGVWHSCTAAKELLNLSCLKLLVRRSYALLPQSNACFF